MPNGGTNGVATKTVSGKTKRPWWSDEVRKAKRECDRNRSKTRVNLGQAFTRWRELRSSRGLKRDIQLALFLLDKESMHSENPSPPSPNEDERQTCAAPFVQPSENGKELRKKDAARQRAESRDKCSATKQSQNKVNRDIQEDEDEEFSTSLSVGDGRYLVDLGSSSEFIVDEECILQLFKLCRECNKQCSVRKRVQGLKLVVYQACCFCQSRCTWTNLPDTDEDDGVIDDSNFQINGKDTAHEQTNTAMLPSSNTS
ncbi:uncharacterized protein LOC111659697 isoform X1 [Seriola lalandi dorsalis]|uniref:uncharacterized protein LOC111659697 isoform X1 n=1 Tax=Seriola lalandi dorsalis TaxID=1841481 RepID=UPI000C6FABCE|nr:uncharacterized protein LOC111659697 isoform X1 [Seriola lalandi dorsalis]